MVSFNNPRKRQPNGTPTFTGNLGQPGSPTGTAPPSTSAAPSTGPAPTQSTGALGGGSGVGGVAAQAPIPTGASSANPAANGGLTTGYNGPASTTPADDPTNALEQQFVDNSLKGPRDTSKDEALIQQQDQQNLGNQLYDQRAAMGASGFGASGAAVGLENTARRNMARQAAQDILGVRNQARNDAFQQGATGMGLDIAGQSAANQSAVLKAQMDALQAILNGGKAPGGAGGAGGGAGSGNPPPSGIPDPGHDDAGTGAGPVPTPDKSSPTAKAAPQAPMVLGSDGKLHKGVKNAAGQWVAGP